MHRQLNVLALLIAGLASIGSAAEWPQWHGPNRDNVSPETGLLKEWPEGGSKLLWTAKGCGAGWASVAIADSLIYTAGDVGGECFVIALDPNGQHRWRTANGRAWTVDYPGSRGTPTVSGGMAYHLNAHGDLICLDAKTGSQIWSLNVLTAFGGTNITWGLAESVLVDGDYVFCSPGGKDACLVALDRRTGKTAWTSKGVSHPAGHASPIVLDYGGVRQVATLTQRGLVAVNAATGDLLWAYPMPLSNQNIPTPLYHDGHLFVTTGSFCVDLKLVADGGRFSVAEAWRTDKLMSYMSGAVLVEGYLYGFHGKHTGGWACVEFENGRLSWGVTGLSRSSLTYADGMLYCLDERGAISLAKATPQEYVVVSQSSIPPGRQGPVWAHPVICGGRLYVRHGDCLHAFDIKATAKEN